MGSFSTGAVRPWMLLVCVAGLLGCGGGTSSPLETAKNMFLDGEFQQAIDAADSVIADAAASPSDQASMRVLKGRCYFEMAAAADPAKRQLELLEQALGELDQCLEFAEQQAAEAAQAKAAANGEEFDAETLRLTQLLKGNLSNNLLEPVAEALHIRTEIHRTLGNRELAIESQRQWRELDSAFNYAYASEGPEEVLRPSRQRLEDELAEDDPEPDDTEPVNFGSDSSDDSDADSGHDESSQVAADLEEPSTGALEGTNGFEIQGDTEISQPIAQQGTTATGRDARRSSTTRTTEAGRGRDATQGAVTQGTATQGTGSGVLANSRRQPNRPSADQGSAETPRSRSNARVPRREYERRERLTSEQELAQEAEETEERESAENAPAAPVPTYPGSPYAFQPDLPGYSAPGPSVSGPSTGIGAAPSYGGPTLDNGVPSTGIGGGRFSAAVPGPALAPPSTGIGGRPPAGNYGAGLGRPGLGQSGIGQSGIGQSGIGPSGLAPALPQPLSPQGIPLTGSLPLNQRSRNALPGAGTRQAWPNYAPLVAPAAPTLPQGLNPQSLSPPRLNPQVPGLGQPGLVPQSSRTRTPNFGAGRRLDGSSSR